MHIMTKLFVFVITLCLTSLVLADSIYKWTDEKGNVHYGNYPKGGNAKEVSIDANPGPSPQSQERAQSAKKRYNSYKQEKEEQQAIDDEDAQMKAYQEELKKACDSYTKNLKLLEQTGRRVYTVDSDDNYHYFSDEERTAKIAELKEKIEKYCKKYQPAQN